MNQATMEKANTSGSVINVIVRIAEERHEQTAAAPKEAASALRAPPGSLRPLRQIPHLVSAPPPPPPPGAIAVVVRA